MKSRGPIFSKPMDDLQKAQSKVSDKPKWKWTSPSQIWPSMRAEARQLLTKLADDHSDGERPGGKLFNEPFEAPKAWGAELRQASCARLEDPEKFPGALRTAGGPESILSGVVTPPERVPERNAARRASAPATVQTKCCRGVLWRLEGSVDFAGRCSGVQRPPCNLTGDAPAGERTPRNVLRVGFYRTEARSAFPRGDLVRTAPPATQGYPSI
jgi:hypothetical protein